MGDAEEVLAADAGEVTVARVRAVTVQIAARSVPARAATQCRCPTGCAVTPFASDSHAIAGAPTIK